jgi:hypothetical protein
MGVKNRQRVRLIEKVIGKGTTKDNNLDPD